MKFLSEDKRYKSLCRFNDNALRQMQNKEIIDCYDDKANQGFVQFEHKWSGGSDIDANPQIIVVSGRYDFGKSDPVVYRGHLPDAADIYFKCNADGNVEAVDISKLAEMLRAHASKVRKRKMIEWISALSIIVLLVFAILLVPKSTKSDLEEDAFAPFRVKIQTEQEEEFKDVKSLYSAVFESVVLIEIYSDEAIGYGTATGMIVSEDGYLISCDHIYEGWINPKFKVVLGDGTAYQAIFVAADKESDISVFKIVEAPITFKPVVFGNSDDLVPGENCVIMGYPGGATVTPVVTSGLISAPKIQINGNSGYMNEYVQTDATANPGNSGGGLFNMSGQVVGIVTSKYTATNYENTTYSIGSKQIENVVNQLLEDGSVTRISLGITFQETTNNDVDNGLPYGCKIVAINEDSAMSSFAKVGQIIVECNGVKLTRATSMYNILFGGELNGIRLSAKIYDPETKSYYFVEFDAKTRESINSYVTQ